MNTKILDVICNLIIHNNIINERTINNVIIMVTVHFHFFSLVTQEYRLVHQDESESLELFVFDLGYQS